MYLESLKETRGKGQNNYFFNDTIFSKFNENKTQICRDIEISTNVNTSNTKKTTPKYIIIKISDKRDFLK